jgi:bifunctional non-homologous end joining protein LigD
MATRRTANPLAEYEAKRHFDQTPEPQPVVVESDGSRFVVQEHHASTLHWDIRLEHDGVLKSWAVPKGPPEEPGIRRLAVQVEDHPVGYIDFHGTIPSGYGSGTVEIWDDGRFELESRAAAKLVFRLHGRRLSGRYSLVRTGGKNWILQQSAVDAG